MKYLSYYEKILQKIMVIVIVLTFSIHLEEEKDLNCKEMYAKIMVVT